jgi:hypothetical protein
MVADGLWSGSNNGNYFEWLGTPSGSTTRSSWMALKQAALIIGTDPGGNDSLRVGGKARLGGGGTNGKCIIGDDSIEIGIGQSADSVSFLDFHAAEGTYGDYAFRIVRSAGANGGAELSNRGSGTLRLNSSDGGVIDCLTNGAQRLVVKLHGQIRFCPLSADPSGPEAGDVYYNSTTNKLRVYNGAWVDLH